MALKHIAGIAVLQPQEVFKKYLRILFGTPHMTSGPLMLVRCCPLDSPHKPTNNSLC